MSDTQQKLEELVEEPMGDDDIHLYFPNAKIMRYGDLQQYSSIDHLLPKEVDYCFILYEDSVNKGHWTCVSKYGSTVEFFDSYGGYPDSQLAWVDMARRLKLNQARPWLTHLFDLCPYNVIYNPFKYQTESEDISTCGRHCVWRIINLVENDKDLEGYYKMMKKLKSETNESYDQIVARMITAK